MRTDLATPSHCGEFASRDEVGLCPPFWTGGVWPPYPGGWAIWLVIPGKPAHCLITRPGSVRRHGERGCQRHRAAPVAVRQVTPAPTAGRFLLPTGGDGSHGPMAHVAMEWMEWMEKPGVTPQSRGRGCAARRGLPHEGIAILVRWRGVRVVEGAALEKRCGDEPPWVRIPPSPPAPV